MPEPEARTRRPKIATVERREARRPDRKGRQGASQAPGVPRHVHAHRCLASTGRRLGAPLPVIWGRNENAAPAHEWSAGGEALAV